MSIATTSATTDSVGPVHYRALVVDDEPGIRQLLLQFLRGEGFEVLLAADGAEALAQLAEHGADVVISDMNMPGMTGAQLLAEVHRRVPGLPALIITGVPTIEAAVECIRLGAFDYITKPFDLKRLKQRIRAALVSADERRATDTVVSAPGQGLAGFHIVGTLGEGHIGVVFLAERRENGRAVQYALKLLKLGGLTAIQRERVCRRFLNEAAAAAKIVHPHVVRFVEYGLAREENIPYLVMEYFPAPTLAQALPDLWPWPWRRKLAMVRQLASALGAVHAQGICHRDIKPGNILVDAAGPTVKVSDFGVAKLPESDLTAGAALLGTPAYMAPEMFLRERVDHRADFFSLGVVAYELLLRARPFSGETVVQLARQIPDARPSAPRRLDPACPPGVQGVLGRLLRKAPAERYPDAATLLRDLDALLDEGTPLSAEVLARLTAGEERDWA